MLKFFRLIRKKLLQESKTTRYLAYAAGEIILVVVGILIALQINNWNESRKLEAQEQQLFTKLLSDLQRDSIILSDALIIAKRHQDLHYHLYAEMKGEASYDSTLEYGLIRFGIPFRPVVTENYQPIVDEIINEEVRESLNTYFRIEKDVQSGGVSQLIDLLVNVVRPYLTSNNISDVDDVFRIPRYEANYPDYLVNYEALKAQFNSPEFGQILYELRVKTSVPILLIGRLLEANSQLQKTIQQALRK